MEIPKELSEICNILPHEIFVVGGFVRDSFLNLIPQKTVDIDICGSFDIKPYFEEISKQGFEIVTKNSAYGGFAFTKNGVTIEYSRFRTEKYKVAGRHSPASVEFVNDVKVDAKRRDFSVNCIYYSTKSKKFFDFYGGIRDINDHILRAIETPQIVFLNDALRILRMVRFACQLDFEIDKQTLYEAKRNVFKLAYLSESVMEREIKKIASIESMYKREPKSRVQRARKILTEIGADRFLSDCMIQFLK